MLYFVHSTSFLLFFSPCAATHQSHNYLIMEMNSLAKKLFLLLAKTTEDHFHLETQLFSIEKSYFLSQYFTIFSKKICSFYLTSIFSLHNSSSYDNINLLSK